MQAWAVRADQLLWAHRYAEAAALALRQLPDDVPPMPTADQLVAISLAARALRASSQYREAAPYFRKIALAATAERPLGGDQSAPGIELAGVLWLAGQRQEALEATRALVEGVIAGTLGYGDRAGGVRQGLLLRYMAAALGNTETAEYATTYLRDRARRSAIKHWPGALARHYLGEVDWSVVVAEASGESSLDAALALANRDLLKRRQLCVALFHGAMVARMAGNEATCRLSLEECAALENPIIECEWYLARAELGM